MNFKNRSWALIILAAGKSQRMNLKIPKPFLKLQGQQTMLEMSIMPFLSIPGLQQIIIVTSQEFQKKVQHILKQKKIVGEVVNGGKEREDSVHCALKSIHSNIAGVLIHDAARPFVTKKLIQAVLQKMFQRGAAIPVVPVKDTIKQIKHAVVQKTIPRQSVMIVQTPQGFKVSHIKSAFEKIGKSASQLTDDASVLEKAGMRVNSVLGSMDNIKITTQQDLQWAKIFIKSKG